MQKNKTFNYSDSQKELKKFQKILKESYGDMMDDDMQGQDPRMMHDGNSQMMQSQGNEIGEGEDGNPLDNPQMNDIISQIRELSIQGIAQFADQVESEEYQSLKKIWLLTDKFYEDAMNNDNDKKKKF